MSEIINMLKDVKVPPKRQSNFCSWVREVKKVEPIEILRVEVHLDEGERVGSLPNTSSIDDGKLTDEMKAVDGKLVKEEVKKKKVKKFPYVWAPCDDFQ